MYEKKNSIKQYLICSCSSCVVSVYLCAVSCKPVDIPGWPIWNQFIWYCFRNTSKDLQAAAITQPELSWRCIRVWLKPLCSGTAVWQICICRGQREITKARWCPDELEFWQLWKRYPKRVCSASGMIKSRPSYSFLCACLTNKSEASCITSYTASTTLDGATWGKIQKSEVKKMFNCVCAAFFTGAIKRLPAL